MQKKKKNHNIDQGWVYKTLVIHLFIRYRVYRTRFLGCSVRTLCLKPLGSLHRINNSSSIQIITTSTKDYTISKRHVEIKHKTPFLFSDWQRITKRQKPVGAEVSPSKQPVRPSGRRLEPHRLALRPHRSLGGGTQSHFLLCLPTPPLRRRRQP